MSIIFCTSWKIIFLFIKISQDIVTTMIIKRKQIILPYPP